MAVTRTPHNGLMAEGNSNPGFGVKPYNSSNSHLIYADNDYIFVINYSIPTIQQTNNILPFLSMSGVWGDPRINIRGRVTQLLAVSTRKYESSMCRSI